MRECGDSPPSCRHSEAAPPVRIEIVVTICGLPLEDHAPGNHRTHSAPDSLVATQRRCIATNFYHLLILSRAFTQSW